MLRIFRMRLRLGYFDPPGPLALIGADQVCPLYPRFYAPLPVSIAAG